HGPVDRIGVLAQFAVDVGERAPAEFRLPVPPVQPVEHREDARLGVGEAVGVLAQRGAPLGVASAQVGLDQGGLGREGPVEALERDLGGVADAVHADRLDAVGVEQGVGGVQYPCAIGGGVHNRRSFRIPLENIHSRSYALC